MDHFVTAALLSRSDVMREATSALPHAPVVPATPAGRAHRRARSRIALAGALERAARAVAPAECSAVR